MNESFLEDDLDPFNNDIDDLILDLDAPTDTPLIAAVKNDAPTMETTTAQSRKRC